MDVCSGDKSGKQRKEGVCIWLTQNCPWRSTSKKSAKLLISTLNALVQSAGFSLKTQPRLLLLLISSHGSTTATVSSWVHLILSSLSRKFRILLQDLFSWHPVTTSQHLSWGKKLHWLPILECIKYKIACMCFSAISGSGPAYISELLHDYTPSRTLRSSSDTRMLEIQQYKRKTHGFRTFSYFGLNIWKFTRTRP